MKDVNEMTMDELISESKELNKRIAKDPQQSYVQRKIAREKAKLARLMGNDYLTAVKKLYQSE